MVRMARMESPPRSMTSARVPMAGSPSAPAQNRAISPARPSPADPAPAGPSPAAPGGPSDSARDSTSRVTSSPSRARSSLPFGPTGSSGSTRIGCGTE
ncbi:hypothetical protein KAURM247S_02073 [Kitasatospora aureofaciens]